jgi:hypothetical protein
MWYTFFNILLAIISVEAITNLLTKSEIFLPVRKFFHDRSENKIFSWFHSLLDCGYCTSVWIGWIIAILFLLDGLCNFFIIGIGLHRLANLFHHIIDRIWGEEEL